MFLAVVAVPEEVQPKPRERYAVVFPRHVSRCHAVALRIQRLN